MQPIPTTPLESACASEAQARLQQLIEMFQSQSNIPGISASIIASGRQIWAGSGVANVQTRAPLRESSLFSLGSIQKFLVALIALRLCEARSIDLASAVTEHLPELKRHDDCPILLWQLLSHTAGYQGENLADPDIVGEYSWEEFTASFNRRPQLFKPGTVFDYSHSGYVVAAKIVERATRKPLDRLLYELLTESLDIDIRDEIFEGDRVADHGFHPHLRTFIPTKVRTWSEFWWPSVVAPKLTLGELALMCKAVSSELVGQQVKRSLLAPVLHLPGQVGFQSEEIPITAALGCMRFANGFYGLNSSTHGQCTAIRFDSEGELVVALGLAAQAPFLRDAMMNKIIESFLHASRGPLTLLTRSMIDTFELEELCGKYEGAQHFTFDVTSENGKLLLRRGHNPSLSNADGSRAIELSKDASHRLVLANHLPNVSVGFFRDPSTSDPCLMLGNRSFRKANQ